jgi:hypothetical protein
VPQRGGNGAVFFPGTHSRIATRRVRVAQEATPVLFETPQSAFPRPYCQRTHMRRVVVVVVVAVLIILVVLLFCAAPVFA